MRDLLARELEVEAETIVARLKAVVESGSDADALRAIEQWMSRVFGRPVDPITMTTPDSLDLSQLTNSELEELRLSLIREKQLESANVYPLRSRSD